MLQLKSFLRQIAISLGKNFATWLVFGQIIVRKWDNKRDVNEDSHFVVGVKEGFESLQRARLM